VTATRKSSRADLDLLAELERLGVKGITERQLERWRQAGAIPSPGRRFLGRGKGSISAYPKGTADRVVRLKELLGRGRTLSKAVLVMFGEGYPVEERALKRAYQWMFNQGSADLMRMASRTDPSLGELEGDAPDPEDLADAAGAPLAARIQRMTVGRAMRRNVRRLPDRKESVDSMMQSVFSNLALLMTTGRPFSEEGIIELVGAVGVAPHTLDRDRFLEAAERMMLPALEAVLAGATLDELEAARDLAAAFVVALEREARQALLPVGGHAVEAGWQIMGAASVEMGDLAVPINAAVLLGFTALTGASVVDEAKRFREYTEVIVTE